MRPLFIVKPDKMAKNTNTYIKELWIITNGLNATF